MDSVKLMDANVLLRKIEERYKASSGMAHRAYSNVIDDIIDTPDLNDLYVTKEHYDMIVEANKILREELELITNILYGSNC